MVDKARIEKAIREIIEAIGEDPSREGVKETPKRVADFYEEFFSPVDSELDVQFSESSDLIMSKVDFFSFCEHHILPFFGKVYIAYIPRDKVVGASKLSKLVYKYAHRLQIQERLTMQIADELWRTLEPYGVMVVVRAKHLCMIMRGVKNKGVLTTSALRGNFLSDKAARLEALRLMNL